MITTYLQSWQGIFFLVTTIYLLSILLIQLFLSIRVWWVFNHAEEHNHHYNRNPRVSIIVPAYNEEVTIIDSLESMLAQDYNNLDIIVINDGSKDDTLNVLKNKYNLKSSREFSDRLKARMKEYPEFDCTAFNDVYYDKLKNIIVIDKKNGGKSTALNMGILLSDSEYTLNVDADTILRKDAISNTLRKKHKDSDAVSCMIGIANEHPLDEDDIQPLFPKMWLVRRQWLEYLTSFVLWRAGNDDHNCITVIPGAYGFIKRSALLDIGGYKKHYLAEDGELTLRLLKGGYKIQFIAEFLAWTEAPDNIRSLGKQRLRWYRGTLQNMIMHRDMLFNSKYGWFLSWFVIPFAWFADVFGSWIELISWIIMGVFISLGIHIDWGYFLLLWGGIILTYSLTMTFMLTFTNRKLKPKEHNSKIYRLIPIIMVETVSYHFLNLYWIIRSHINEYMNKEHKWNKFRRKGFRSRVS